MSGGWKRTLQRWMGRGNGPAAAASQPAPERPAAPAADATPEPTPEERRHGLVGPAHLWKMKRDFQIEFLTRQGLRPDQSLMDFGCGTLRGGIPLIDYLDAGRYTGVEVAKHRLDEGRAELAESGLADKQPTLVLAEDLEALTLDARFDLIWAFSVLIHLHDAQLDVALRFVQRHLGPSGRFLANVHVGEREDRVWAEFPCVWRPLEFYAESAAKAGLAFHDLGSGRDHGHHSGVKQQDDVRMIELRLAER